MDISNHLNWLRQYYLGADQAMSVDQAEATALMSVARGQEAIAAAIRGQGFMVSSLPYDQMNPPRTGFPLLLGCSGLNADLDELFTVMGVGSDDQYLILDGSGESREVPIDTFWRERDWWILQVALAPVTDRFTEQSSNQSSLRSHWFFGPLLRAKGIYFQVAIAALMVNVFALTTSIFSMIVYDRVIPNQAVDTLTALLVGAGIVFLSDFIIRTLRGYFLDSAGVAADTLIGEALFEQVMEIKTSHRTGSSGATASLMKEFEALRDFLTSTTLVTLIDIPFAIIFLLVIWSIGGPMVWVPLAAIPLMLGSGLLVQPIMRRITKASQVDGHRKHSVLVETLQGMDTVKAMGASQVMMKRWRTAVASQSQLGLRQRMWASFAANIANLAQQLVQVGVVTVGFFLVGEGALGFGAIIACTILSGRAISPLAQLTQLLTKVNQSMASYKSLDALMGLPREHTKGHTYVRRPSLQGRIEFRNVTFTYPEASQPTLKNVSFTIEVGEHIGILGRIGSGKSTIAKLLLGIYQPDDGVILVDGVNVSQIDPDDLRRNLGAVLQDIWLSAGSIRDNIAMRSGSVSNEELLRVGTVTGVSQFVDILPQGYETQLRERGEGLSGGQRQAICIARALVGEPTTLVLDEPTSAMDQQAEQTIVNCLAQESNNKTLLVVTHKAALMKLVSRVLVIDGGKIAYDGPPERLAQGRGA